MCLSDPGPCHHPGVFLVQNSGAEPPLPGPRGDSPEEGCWWGEGQMQPLWPEGKRCFSITRSKVLTEGKHLNFQINGFPYTLQNRIAGQIYPSHSVLENPSYRLDLDSYNLASALNSDISTLISTWCGRYITRDVLVAWNFPTQL